MVLAAGHDAGGDLRMSCSPCVLDHETPGRAYQHNAPQETTMIGYTPAELELMTTTELLALLQSTHLTNSQIRLIKAEIKERVI